jgi:membrane protein DedA with SNARE-associated domain
MANTTAFLIRHGYLILFASVLAQQLGLPLPSTPFILAAGALAFTGVLNFGVALFVACLAAILADLMWYEIGRRRGIKVLQFLCRISLEPDYCVRRTENSFERYGPKMLLIAKLVPGISAVATPLAGVNGLLFSRFLLFDGLGILLWIGTFELIGFLFSNQLEQIVDYSARFGSLAFGILVAGLVGYIAWKYIQRRRFLRSLRIARITPVELKQQLDSGSDVLIVDLRHPLDFASDPRTLPGAIRLAVEDIEERNSEIPRDRTLVLYCT